MINELRTATLNWLQTRVGDQFKVEIGRAHV